MNSSSFVVAGLGNPGNKYEKNRHNVGFMFVDWFADKHGSLFSTDKHQSFSSRIRLNDLKIHLLKPQTFMNRSGRAVAGYCRYFDADPSHLLVVHDDIDMHPGRVKLVDGGGTGGHNGIRSIAKELGRKDFFRLKIGVGRPGVGSTHPEMEVEKYVLADFSDKELKEIQFLFEDINYGIDLLFKGDVPKAMTFLNAIK